MTAAAIIVASGSGKRAGFDKLLALLNGRPVLEWSIRAFAACPEIGQIIVVCPAERFAALNLEGLATPITRVDGGAERHHSVANGLAALPSSTDIIAVHDGARPLIQPSAIISTIQGAQEHEAVALARPITETVKRSDNEGRINSSMDRKNLWAMETPQTFSAPLLREAYAKVVSGNLLVTDEVSAVEHLGKSTTLIKNPSPNLKITFPEDLLIAEKLTTR